MQRSKKKFSHRQIQAAEQSAQARAILESAEPVVCKKCGCPFFDEVKTIKYISSILAPNGQKGYAMIPKIVCLGCMTILPEPGDHGTIKKEGIADARTSSETERSDDGDVGQTNERPHISVDP